MLGWELPPHNSGGLGQACFGLSRALAKKGVNITFVLPKKVNLDVDFMNVVFANVDEELSQLKKISYTTSSQVWSKSFKIDDFPPDFVRAAYKFGEKIENIAKKYSGELIHSHDWMTGPAGVVAKKAIKRPLVTHIHSTEIDRTGGNSPNPFVYQIEKEEMQNSDRVISVSQYTKNMIANNYGISPSKISVVHNGIDEEKKELLPVLPDLKKLGYKLVLFLGRITLMKGPEYFVKAARKVLMYNPKTLFIVAGSGDMQDFMMAEAARLGIIDKFLFTGFIRGEERDRIFQSADLYVMPSVSEPFGIVALESIVQGTPVIISKQSGASEILNHVLKVDFWDTDEMANKMVAVLKLKNLPEVMIKESEKEVKNYNWENSANKVLRVYKDLI